MAAPAPTVRQDPTGIKLTDGYRSLVTFSLDPNIELWEKSITPPGLDGGDAIDTNTMHNDRFRTMASRALITMTEMSFTSAYDPIIYTRILDVVNVEQTITLTFPDGSTMAFYGFVRVLDFGELVEGTFPEVTVTIQPTNADPTTKTEEALVLASVAGT